MKKRYYLAIASTLLLPLASAVYAGGDATAGKEKSTQCAACHGPNGEGSKEYPKIAGMDPKVFSQALEDFKTGKRKHAIMDMIAKQLSEEDIADLAAFYEKK
jgi:cytochrome c553